MSKTKCPTCEAQGLDHDTIVQQCLSSPWHTGILLCGFDWLRSEYHQLLNQWYIDGLNDGCRNFLVMTARDHLKTTLFGMSRMVWNVIRNPDLRTMYMMASSEEADKKLNAVKGILQNSQAIRHFFPGSVLDMKNPRVKSKASYLRLPRTINAAEGTLEARGVDSLTTGGHFDDQIFDDLIDERMVYSDVKQQQAINKIKNSPAMFVDMKVGERLIIGTRWPGPFYEWLMSDAFSGYRRLVIGAEVDERFRTLVSMCGKRLDSSVKDGDPVWPEHFTTEVLQDTKRLDPYIYAHQWLNLEASEGSRRFQKSDIMYFKWYKDGKSPMVELPDGNFKVYDWRDLERILTIDPSTGEGVDESAIVVCGYSRQTGNAFVLDSWAEKVTPFELIEQILDMAVKWKPKKICPEEVAFQKTLKHYLQQEMLKRKLYFHIQAVKPGNKVKGARIVEALQPFVRNHQMWFSREQADLINELLTLQIIKGRVVGRSPNLIDALAYHPQFWRIDPSGFGDTIDDDDEDVPRMPKQAARYGLEVST